MNFKCEQYICKIVLSSRTIRKELINKNKFNENNLLLHRNVRPVWLTNPKTGKRLEIDILLSFTEISERSTERKNRDQIINKCENIICAIEVNGKYHRKTNDKMKERMLLSKKIPLLVLKTSTWRKMTLSQWKSVKVKLVTFFKMIN